MQTESHASGLHEPSRRPPAARHPFVWYVRCCGHLIAQWHLSRTTDIAGASVSSRIVAQEFLPFLPVRRQLYELQEEVSRPQALDAITRTLRHRVVDGNNSTRLPLQPSQPVLYRNRCGSPKSQMNEFIPNSRSFLFQAHPACCRKDTAAAVSFRLRIAFVLRSLPPD